MTLLDDIQSLSVKRGKLTNTILMIVLFSCANIVFFYYILSSLFIHFAACLTLYTDCVLQITVCTELSALWDGMSFRSLLNYTFFKEHESGLWLL